MIKSNLIVVVFVFLCISARFICQKVFAIHEKMMRVRDDIVILFFCQLIPAGDSCDFVNTIRLMLIDYTEILTALFELKSSYTLHLYKF